MTAAIKSYAIPSGDICAYLKGFWKRNLEWRHFGSGFQHLRSTNSVVFIEEDADAARQPNTQFLRWSFGRTLKQQDLAVAYTVQFIPDEQGIFMEWSFEGVTCHGVFKPETNVAILNFCLRESVVTITYRVLDANTMAVCIVDVDSEHTPTVQYGNMYRINPSKYDRTPSMACKRIAIGGTFACDEALAVPLQYLLANAVWNINVNLHWLRYGSLTNFNEWTKDVLHPARSVDLIILLVRLSDLEVVHPEFQSLCMNQEKDQAIAHNSDGGVGQLLHNIEQHDSMTNSSPLLVLLCPCPPDMTTMFDAMECKVQKQIKTMRHVDVQISKQLLALYDQQYTTPYYDVITDKRQHSPYTQAMLNVISLSLCRQICRLYRPTSNPKKVIVLDCDNTLWGGAIAEVGSIGIDLGPRFLSLQRFVVAQQQKGMLLALCSKNLLDDVLDAFTLRRDDMVLNLDKHVVATKINWKPKSENIVQLAKDLNLGIDSFIFIDDNPLECSEVKTALPSITVIPLGEKFSDSVLLHEWIFDECLSSRSCDTTTKNGTMEDASRTQLYQQNFQRNQLCETFSTHEAFLSALDVKIVFEELDKKQELCNRSPSFTRALQLLQRTNQFNTATTFTKRLEKEALLDYVAASEKIVLCAHVTDRFGHYGLVSVVLFRYVCETKVLRVDSFILSCRALNRGVEHAVVRKLSEIAARLGASSLEVAWEPTERNQPAHAFFSGLFDVKFIVEAKRYSVDIEKAGQQSSLSHDGLWILAADRGRSVCFLKTEGSYQRSVMKNDSIEWIPYLRSNLSLQNIAHKVILWMLLLNLLPHWLTRPLIKFLADTRDKESTGMLRVTLRDRGSLERFLSPALSSAKNIVVQESSVTASNICKFRRKARHQTKLALVNHLDSEASRVIWSANRPQAPITKKQTVAHEESVPVVRLQLICKSPECFATIQLENRCTFQRCRICCYRLQRLLMRSKHHPNAEARQSAKQQR
ncbi:-like protein [Plasmopara halstedii]|uniref:-like protein n=1 Tax=Plasmopara halstedii TaxID=4781 RepID=A0A0P1ABZ7_PLAHL|nr:-like protein [Plasmopara halstedii]CEG38458.1 -like protein [Plasmopara halstedii]|eukprot:XP_024574827.1 -like protein [Plasmopara halstedii]